MEIILGMQEGDNFIKLLNTTKKTRARVPFFALGPVIIDKKPQVIY